MTDEFDLSRFVDAQSRDHAQALAELRAGNKQSHWIWYVLPQLRGLGMSQASAYYGIDGAAEAKAYLAHPVLGARLIECVAAVNALTGRTATQIFGSVDAMKFRSCLTLFAEVADDPAPFRTALERYFGGEADGRTLELLRHTPRRSRDS